MATPSENPDRLLHPQVVTDLLLYRLNVITRSASLPMVRLFEGELGITHRHWHMLALLVQHGAMPPSQLASLTWLDRPRISRAISGLVDKGLVQRAAGAARTRPVGVTDAGRRLYARAMQRVGAFNAQLALTMSGAERQLFDDCLRRLQSRVQQLTEEATRNTPPAPRNRRRA
jgi:DNA-binding MarR family transcriptional regulator